MRYIRCWALALVCTIVCSGTALAVDYKPDFKCSSGGVYKLSNDKYWVCGSGNEALHQSVPSNGVTCPSGSTPEYKRITVTRPHIAGGSDTITGVRCKEQSEANKPSHVSQCGQDEILEGSSCVNKKVRRQNILNDEVFKKIPKNLLEDIYKNYHKSTCPQGGADLACNRATFDEFKKTYFADEVYRCTVQFQRESDELGVVNGSEKKRFAECLSKSYKGLNTEKILNYLNDSGINEGDLGAMGARASTGAERSPDIVPTSQQDQGENSKEDRADACSENLDGIGWLVCPVLWATAKAADGALEILKHFLNVPPEILAVNSPTFQAWSYFRNIANAMFAVVFLWLIFSQITNMGIDNYGIKKMLPRLIVGAVLVNISFYITQIAVDLSNILGYSVEDMLEEAAKSVQGGNSNQNAGWQTGLEVLFAGLAGGALIIGMILLGQSVLLACLLAVAITLCIIIARQALVVLLVALSPVAFVSWLLPNTEALFKKWLGLLRAMLVLFPLVALIYGGGKLASHILMNVATSNSNDTNEFLQIAALGVAFLPLGSTPFVLRSSLNMLGSLSTKLSKASSWANKRIGTAVRDKSRLGEMWNNQKLQSLKRRADRRRGESKIARYGRQITQDPNSTKLGMFLSSKIGSDKVEKLGRAMSFKGDMTKLIDESPIGVALGGVGGQAAATRRASEVFEKEVKDSSLLLQGKQMDEIKDFATGAVKTSGAMRAAAIDHVMSQGGFSDRRSVIESVASDAKMDTSMRQRAIDGAYAKGDGNIYGAGFGGQILSGQINGAETLAMATVDNVANGDLSAEHLVQNASATDYVANSILTARTNSYGREPDATRNFRSAASDAMSSSGTKGKVSNNIFNSLSKV